MVLLWTPRLTCLSGPVSGLPLPASPLASADSHYLCNVRPWLCQGLGCSRADPRGIFSLSACSLTCCVFARAEEDLSPPLQTPCGSRAQLATSPSAWSWFSAVPRVVHFCTSLGKPRSSVRKLRSAPLFGLGFRDRSLACSESSCYCFGLRVALPPKLSRV